MVANPSVGATYKGIELANNGSENLLCLSNFSNASVDVFDSSFQPIRVAGGFADPNLPICYPPFNTALINGQLFVTYAMQNASKTAAVLCPGCGYVNVFDVNGFLIERFASGGVLNAPWGLAEAPANFGTVSGDVLIGNLGDGRINAFKSGAFLGQLLNSAGNPIAINSLRGLRFGNGGNAGLENELFYAAGPGGYKHGRFGKITFQ